MTAKRFSIGSSLTFPCLQNASIRRFFCLRRTASPPVVLLQRAQFPFPAVPVLRLKIIGRKTRVVQRKPCNIAGRYVAVVKRGRAENA